jgi:glycyl-tRNA synthetase beta chain
VEFAGLTSGRTTRGHRFLAPEPVAVPAAADFFLALERGKVMPDAEGRALFIREGLAAAAEGENATAVVPEKVFAEVVNLVEYPTVGVGHFDESFLRVPREVLETAMESHQRYFPLEAADGALTSGFLVVHNGDPKRTDAIIRGHERVIRARLADAAFFYDEDLKVGMDAWADQLGAIVFQEKLGTLAAKVERIEALVTVLAQASGAAPDVAAHAVRAAHLCKADLVSHAVVEFPSLQGVMGRYYALAGGEHAEVADAVAEHYRPRFAGDDLPTSDAGVLVAAADRFDTICGIFAIGDAPTGSSDPYALRRAAIGLLTMAIEGRLRYTLDETIAAALAPYLAIVTDTDADAVAAEVKAFIVGRLEVVLRDRGNAYDTVAAVLAASSDDPYDAGVRCLALTEARGSEAIADLSVAFARAKNLAQPGLGTEADRALMLPAESALADAMDGGGRDFAAAMAIGDYQEALGVLAQLRGPIDTFFDDVLVMDPDPAVRDNRLRLLNRFVALFGSFADFSKLAG